MYLVFKFCYIYAVHLSDIFDQNIQPGPEKQHSYIKKECMMKQARYKALDNSLADQR